MIVIDKHEIFKGSDEKSLFVACRIEAWLLCVLGSTM